MRRASDWFFKSLEGLLGNDDGEPIAFAVNTKPCNEAHFAVFPEGLVEPCVKSSSRPGDAVLDPFAGSGTTGKVSVSLGRSFVGIELNPAYAEMARKRIGSAAPLFAAEVPA